MLILFRSRDPVSPRDVLSGLAHRDVGLSHQLGVKHAVASERRVGGEIEPTLRHHGHALDASGDRQYVLFSLHRRR